jgi:hypothetical protein
MAARLSGAVAAIATTATACVYAADARRFRTKVRRPHAQSHRAGTHTEVYDALVFEARLVAPGACPKVVWVSGASTSGKSTLVDAVDADVDGIVKVCIDDAVMYPLWERVVQANYSSIHDFWSRMFYRRETSDDFVWFGAVVAGDIAAKALRPETRLIVVDGSLTARRRAQIEERLPAALAPATWVLLPTDAKAAAHRRALRAIRNANRPGETSVGISGSAKSPVLSPEAVRRMTPEELVAAHPAAFADAFERTLAVRSAEAQKVHQGEIRGRVFEV